MNMIRKNISAWNEEFKGFFEKYYTVPEGRNELLEEQVKKKLQKNKSPKIIAEELEENLSVIKKIIEKLTQ